MYCHGTKSEPHAPEPLEKKDGTESTATVWCPKCSVQLETDTNTAERVTHDPVEEGDDA